MEFILWCLFFIYIFIGALYEINKPKTKGAPRYALVRVEDLEDYEDGLL